MPTVGDIDFSFSRRWMKIPPRRVSENRIFGFVRQVIVLIPILPPFFHSPAQRILPAQISQMNDISLGLEFKGYIRFVFDINDGLIADAMH